MTFYRFTALGYRLAADMRFRNTIRQRYRDGHEHPLTVADLQRLPALLEIDW